MIRTALCDLLDIEHPIIQAAIWPATSPELVAAVSNAGGLGSIGAVFESPEALEEQLTRVQDLTDHPFTVNHVVPLLDEEAFARTLAARPAVISFALGDPGDLVKRAHEVGAKVIHQVHTVQQARQAADVGVDAIIAQGSEAGGQGMVTGVGTLALVPQVVDTVHPIPVLAAGGIADGRGLAAALVLGAQGVNIGTRFLASEEASAAESWKEAVLAAESDEVHRFEVWREIFPAEGGSAYLTVPRVLQTPFVVEWSERPGRVERQAEHLRGEIMTAIRERRAHELLPFAGQTAGMIDDVLPAGDIVRRMIAEAEEALRDAERLIG
jgi:nitronate monooxygenase/enoyl-[acyl-carrier protein] reductase II